VDLLHRTGRNGDPDVGWLGWDERGFARLHGGSCRRGSSLEPGGFSIAVLNISQDLMRQILATLGPAFPGFSLTASGGVARLKVFSVTLAYTVPAPASLLLLAAGAACLAAAARR